MFSHLLIQKSLSIFQYSPQQSFLIQAYLPLPISFIHRDCPITCSMEDLVLCVEYHEMRKAHLCL